MTQERTPALTPAEPESVGMSSRRLERISHYLKQEVDAGRIPGATAIIARKGHVVYSHAVGYLDETAKTPMPLDAIFQMYSMTKPLVSVGAMMLCEEGRLQLTDPLSKFFPEFAKQQVSVPSLDVSGKVTFKLVEREREITVKDLLCHTAGLAYPSWTSHTHVLEVYTKAGLFKPGTKAFDIRDVSIETQIEALSKAPLVHQPGTAFEYSYASDMLGRVVEKASDMRLSAFLEERLFKPLRMSDTAFYVPKEKMSRLAKPPLKDPETGETIQPHDVSALTANDSGGSGSVSTAMDYLRFSEMMLRNGILDGERIISRPAVRLMTSDQLGPTVSRAHDPGDVLLESPGYTFGLGFMVREAAGNAVVPGSEGEFMWAGAVGTFFWIDPAEEMTAVLMTQISGHTRIPYRRAFKQLAYQAIDD